jgi:signal transduction histidine kinase
LAADRRRSRRTAAGSSIGVGLGLTLSRGLTEAMRGTMKPELKIGGPLRLFATTTGWCRLGPGVTIVLPP